MLAGVTLGWGATDPIRKIAALEIPVFTFRGTIAIGAGVVMFVLARVAGHSLAIPPGNRVGLLVASLLNTGLTHCLATFGTLYISAGQTATILYTMPVWAFLIGIPVLGERPRPAHWLGLALGISGIALIGAQHADERLLSPGVLVALAGAISWAGGTIANKRVKWRMPMFVMTGWQFVIGGLPLLAIAVVLETDRIAPVSAEAFGAALFVMLLPLIFGYWAFFRIVDMVPANVAALSVVAVPGVSFALGRVLLDETVSTTDMVAFALIVGALATVLPKPARRRNGTGARR
jgi:drug/metabolite transporter (DMT)-like permease